MFTTKDLVFKKKKPDIETIYNNVFIQEETAKYMLWKPSESINVARDRVNKWSSWENMFWIYLKTTNEPIGFLNFIENGDKIENIGLCIGKDYIRKGFGEQALQKLCKIAKQRDFHLIEYSAIHDNVASIELAKKLGFTYTHSGTLVRKWDNKNFQEDFLVKYL